MSLVVSSCKVALRFLISIETLEPNLESGANIDCCKLYRDNREVSTLCQKDYKFSCAGRTKKFKRNMNESSRIRFVSNLGCSMGNVIGFNLAMGNALYFYNEFFG